MHRRHDKHTNTPESEANQLIHNITLVCDVAKPNFKLLTETRLLPSGTHPLRNVIQRLAFIYRFHLFILSIALLAEYGNHREEFYALRNKLLHRMNINLLSEEIINRTSQLMNDVSLDELDKLNYTYRNIKGNEIFAALKKLPLYKAIHAEKDHKELAILAKKKWLKEIAIPLLNYIWQPNKHLDYHERREEYDASKMLVMVIGAYCPESNHQRLFKQDIYLDFMNACRKLRCEYSHSSLTHKLYHRIDELVALGKKITPNILDDAINIADSLFPITDHPDQQPVQVDTSYLKPCVAH